MKKSTKKTILITTSVLALSASLFAAFGGSFDFEQLSRARASGVAVEDGTITFDGSKSTITGSNHNFTYTTNSTTSGGYSIQSIATKCYNSNAGYLAYFSSTAMTDGTKISFNNPNSSSEFAFQNLKQITINVSTDNSRIFVLKYKSVDSSDVFSANLNTANKTGSYDFDAAGEDVESLEIYIGQTAITYVTSIVLTYDCGSDAMKTLTGLSITNAPDKVEYLEGDVFDPTGMVITASFNKGASRVVTNKCAFPTNTLDTSDTSATIGYSYRGVTMYVNQSITVSAQSEDPCAGTYTYSTNTLVLNDNGEGSYSTYYGDSHALTWTYENNVLTINKADSKTSFAYDIFAGSETSVFPKSIVMSDGKISTFLLGVKFGGGDKMDRTFTRQAS